MPWHEGTALCLADLRVGATARRSSPRRARSCAASSTGSPSAAWTAVRRHRARVHRLPATPTRRRGSKRLPRPRAGQPLQRRLLAARHRARRAADPPDPQRDGRRRACVVENSKGECNFGQHEINFHYGAGAADRRRARRSTRTAPRRSPPRRAWRSPSWPSSTSARATRATSTSRCGATDGSAAVRRRRRRPFDRFLAGQLACLRELTLFFAPNINSYKRFAAGLVRADRGRLGRRQPHVLAARRRPRRRAALRAARCRAPTSTPTSRWRR